ncbi:hypothetical protein AC249_AIPGENE20904, partial [Exaiptasia diaphana]
MDHPQFEEKGYYHYTASNTEKNSEITILRQFAIDSRMIDGEMCNGYTVVTDRGAATAFFGSEEVNLTGFSKYLNDPVYELLDALKATKLPKQLLVNKQTGAYVIDLVAEPKQLDDHIFQVPAGYQKFKNTFYNSANVFVAPDAEVHVFGDMVSDGPTTILEHEGFIQTYEDGNPGNFELQNGATVSSIGDYRIENDWVNNGAFLMTAGLVEMYGDNQWFLGNNISRFWNLLLTGTNVKEQGQDIRIQNELDITSRELAVHDLNMTVENTASGSIVFDATFGAEGIISTDEDGIIRKAINVNEQNIVPTGSNDGPFVRHRPVKLTRMDGGMDTAFVTFHYHSPDLVGAPEADMDTSLCKIQTAYFFTVNSENPTNRYQLDFAHYPPQDGFYPDVAQWDNPTWKVVYDHSDYSDANYQYARA